MSESLCSSGLLSYLNNAGRVLTSRERRTSKEEMTVTNVGAHRQSRNERVKNSTHLRRPSALSTLERPELLCMCIIALPSNPYRRGILAGRGGGSFNTHLITLYDKPVRLMAARPTRRDRVLLGNEGEEGDIFLR